MKRIIFALIIFMMAVGIAAAGEVNSTDGMISQAVIDDGGGSEDVLAMSEDFFDETDDGTEDFSNSNLEIVEQDLESDSKYLKISLTNKTDNAPIAGVDLGVVTSDVLTSDWYVEKITTNSKGIATYKLPFNTGSKSIAVGLYLEYGDSGGLTTSNDVVKVNFLKTKLKLKDAQAKLSLKKSGDSYGDTVLTVTLLDENRKGVTNAEVSIKFSNGVKKKLKTDSKGKAKYSLPFKPGKYSVTAKVLSEGIYAKDVTLKNIKITKASAKLAPAKLKTTYQSGKAFKVKVTNAKSKHALEGVSLILKVYTGSKSKKYTVTTDSKGTASFDTSKLSIGSHKIVVSVKDSKCVSAKSKTSSVKISKATLRISAPDVTKIYNRSGEFKVTVMNKESGKAMKGVKVTVKVFTGSKYKTYSLKTNSKGEASISTKSLSKATHNVAVNVKGTSDYKANSAKSSIRIYVPEKINTSFRVNEVKGTIWAGSLESVDVDADLIDAKGNVLTNKKVSLQLFAQWNRFGYYIYHVSDKYTSNLVDPVHIDTNYYFGDTSIKFQGSDEIGVVYVELTFEGDDEYNGCTADFRPAKYRVYFDSNTYYDTTKQFYG